MRRVVIGLVATLLMLATAPATAQEQSWTADELAARCDLIPSQRDACLNILYTVFIPDAGRTPPPDTTATTGSDSPHSFSGTTGQTTPPFDLAGGDYRITWRATAGKYGCFIGASLENTNGEFMFDGRVSELVDANQTSDGETYVYALEGGRYYFDTTNNTCTWSLSIAPL